MKFFTTSRGSVGKNEPNESLRRLDVAVTHRRGRQVETEKPREDMHPYSIYLTNVEMDEFMSQLPALRSPVAAKVLRFLEHQRHMDHVYSD